MSISFFYQKTIHRLTLQLLFGFIGFTSFSQVLTTNNSVPITNYASFLDQKPYFADHQAAITDSLFIKDVDVLKHLGSFDSVDVQLLKVPVLKNILSDEMEKGKPATYRTIIDFMDGFRRTIAYKDFVSGVLLFRDLENKKVNKKNWDNDRALFIKLGFSESDLEDFYAYIKKRKNRKLTYKAAYLQYMKEIEELTAPRPLKRD